MLISRPKTGTCLTSSTDTWIAFNKSRWTRTLAFAPIILDLPPKPSCQPAAAQHGLPLEHHLIQKVTLEGHKTWKSHCSFICESTLRKGCPSLCQELRTCVVTVTILTTDSWARYWLGLELVEQQAISPLLPFYSSTSVAHCQSKSA